MLSHNEVKVGDYIEDDERVYKIESIMNGYVKIREIAVKLPKYKFKGETLTIGIFRFRDLNFNLCNKKITNKEEK